MITNSIMEGYKPPMLLGKYFSFRSRYIVGAYINQMGSLFEEVEVVLAVADELLVVVISIEVGGVLASKGIRKKCIYREQANES